MVELSVHLITFNNEGHIEETLQSILKQKTTFSYEIVVGDDCSTDNTLNIIDKYAKKKPELFKVKKNERSLGIINPIYNEPTCWQAECHVHSQDQKVLVYLLLDSIKYKYYTCTQHTYLN